MRDDHTRVWYLPFDVEITNPETGQKRIEHIITRYYEKGGGLCYLDSSGHYVPSSPEWQKTASGFLLAKAAYSVEAPGTAGAGIRLSKLSHILEIKPAKITVSDGNKEALLFALNTDASPVFDPESPFLLRYPGAFGPGVDVEIRARKAELHVDLVIPEPIELPPDFDPQDTNLRLYLELNLDGHCSQIVSEFLSGY